MDQLPRRHAIDSVTVVCYMALACLGFLLDGLGPILPFLESDLRVGRAAVALLPLLDAAGLVVVGLVGVRLFRSVGRRKAFWAALVAMLGGALVLAVAQSILVAEGGAAVMGFGAAFLILLVPPILSDRHGTLAAGAIAEANAISSSAAVLAPLCIAAAVASGVGWRIGYVALPVIVGAGLFAAAWRVPIVSDARSSTTTAHPAPHPDGSFVRRWLDIVLVVSVEFCFVVWSTDYLRTRVGLGDAAAPAVAALFLVGMTLGRALGGQSARRLADPRPVFRLALAVALVGFVAFWSTREPLATALGLLVAGSGVALLYPLSLVRTLAAARGTREGASARAALASGLAIGIAPFVLALLADRVGLQAAFLLVPFLLAAVAVNDLVPARSGARLRQS